MDEKCTTHVFLLEEGEYLASIEVRAGAWIDGIRFHTNWKSSIWFGGQGGTLDPLVFVSVEGMHFLRDLVDMGHVCTMDPLQTPSKSDI